MKKPAPPWFLVIPSAAVFVITVLPLIYLVFRALEAERGLLYQLVFRHRNFELILNTLGLAGAVVAGTLVLALPLAWLTTSTNLRGRYLVTVLCMIPLATPGYVVAYGLLSLSSPSGPLQQLFGLGVARMTGFWGALLTLIIYNYPFMYLNLRTAFVGRDPSIIEAAKSLGYGPIRRFARITLPQLRPAILAGTMLVGLYVFGDFGVVSLMRFETISYAIFLQYLAAFDRIYAAWLALMLLGIAVLLLLPEFFLLRGLRIDRSGRSTRPRKKLYNLGGWQWAALLFVTLVALVSVVIPNSVMLYWLGRQMGAIDVPGVVAALGDSLSVSLPAASLATLLAIPIAFLERRHRTGLTQLIGSSVYIGYATPPLALALGYVFFVLRAAPWLYQTAGLLAIAYTVHFLAQAVGPVRTSLFLATPRVEEASRSLGQGPFETLRKVTFPLLRPGLVGAGALVFLSCIKELPLTFLLAPLNFQTLAIRVYGFTSEAMFAEAAPHAVSIVVLSAVLIGLLFKNSVEFR
jgi:iron(III) transport system permease protein